SARRDHTRRRTAASHRCAGGHVQTSRSPAHRHFPADNRARRTSLSRRQTSASALGCECPRDETPPRGYLPQPLFAAPPLTYPLRNRLLPPRNRHGRVTMRGCRCHTQDPAPCGGSPGDIGERDAESEPTPPYSPCRGRACHTRVRTQGQTYCSFQYF